MSEKMRKEFEAWALKGEWHIDLLYDHGYAAWETQCAFDAWQASREALVIELPPLSGMNSSFVADGIQKTREHNRYNSAVKDCRKAIEAAGLKVKA